MAAGKGAASMLTCERVGISFGGVAALSDVSFTVAPGEAVGLIGPNGSGKTSLVNVISGYYRPSAGSVILDGRPIHGRSPQRIRSRGISRVFQNLRLFSELTATENLQLGLMRDVCSGAGIARATVASIFGGGEDRHVAQSRSRAKELLEDNGLGAIANQRVGELSYGQRKELELLCAIAVPPLMLLLDEPTSGVSDREAEFFKQRILEWKAQFGFGILIVEHRLGWLFGTASRLIVLNEGRIIATGSSEEIANDPAVRRAYVGT
jgi:ABC-type branched-subunit amino acid transport system ATPase component